MRVAAKELTSLILDEERLRAERSDRKSWKSRVHGLDEYGPPDGYNGESSRPREQRQPRRQNTDENDAEYRLAIEASKAQEEEDRRRREGRAAHEEDDDLAKAIQLSKEEEERRRKELEESNAALLFDDSPVATTNQQPAFTGFNQGYQQGQPVDFFANPIDQSQLQVQQTGYIHPLYTGYQQTGYPNGFPNGFGVQSPGGFDPYGQQQGFQPQVTGFNPYLQQQPAEPAVQPGSNNPWATPNASAMAQKPMATGSNNPFASTSSPFGGRPTVSKAPTLSALPEQKTLSNFSLPPPTSFTPQPQPVSQPPPQRELSEHEARLNALLASGDGMDTFGNTGQLRIPAQHTAPGTFVNSAGSGVARLTASATGAPAANPFLRTQFTGMPAVSYPGAGGAQHPAATGPIGSTNNPFAGAAGRGQQGPQGDLIQF